MPGVPLVGPPATSGSCTPLTDTLTSTPPCSADWLSELLDEESDEDEDDEDEDDDDRDAVDDEELEGELRLGRDGDDGWRDEEALGIEGAEGEDGDEEALGIDGADELDDEDDELGIEGMELLELLELELLWQPANSTARHDAVSSAFGELFMKLFRKLFRKISVTGVLMSCPRHAAYGYATCRYLASQGPAVDRVCYRLTSAGRGQHLLGNIGFSPKFTGCHGFAQ